MKKFNLETMPTDQLWALHEEVTRTLAAGLCEEKRVLDEQLKPFKQSRARAPVLSSCTTEVPQSR